MAVLIAGAVGWTVLHKSGTSETAGRDQSTGNSEPAVSAAADDHTGDAPVTASAPTTAPEVLSGSVARLYGGEVNLRAEPSADSKLVQPLYNQDGNQVTVVGFKEGWFKVNPGAQFAQQTGYDEVWIYGGFVDDAEDSGCALEAKSSAPPVYDSSGVRLVLSGGNSGNKLYASAGKDQQTQMWPVVLPDGQKGFVRGDMIERARCDGS